MIPKKLTETFPFVCPVCRGALHWSTEAECRACGKTFGRRNGFLDFTLGEWFADEVTPEALDIETRAGEYRTRHFLLPLLIRTFSHTQSPRVLEVGCGAGVQVDLLNEGGIETWGTDCGDRVTVWPQRRHQGQLALASGRALPFAEAFFDAVVSFGVIEHIGVIGDTYKVAPDRDAKLRQFAVELTKVTRTGGLIILSTPNRLFPVDFWHHEGSFGGFRLHGPGDRFLLSLADIRHLFVDAAGCREVEVLPHAGYFAYYGASTFRWKRAVSGAARAYFRAFSSPALKGLLSSPLNPFLIVSVRR